MLRQYIRELTYQYTDEKSRQEYIAEINFQEQLESCYQDLS